MTANANPELFNISDGLVVRNVLEWNYCGIAGGGGSAPGGLS